MALPMTIARARRTLEEYRKADFNASKGLVNAGFAKSTATKGSKKVINTALKKVIKEDMEKIVSSSNPIASIFGYVGISPQDAASEFLKIIKQDKDLTNKLKALQPLLATQGIKWNEEKILNAPTLNITVKENTPATPTADSMAVLSHDSVGVAGVEDVAQYTLLNDDAATPTPDEDEAADDVGVAAADATPLSPSSSVDGKEGGSPTQNFVEKDTIDKIDKVLPITFTENVPPTPTISTTPVAVVEATPIVADDVVDKTQ